MCSVYSASEVCRASSLCSVHRAVYPASVVCGQGSSGPNSAAALAQLLEYQMWCNSCRQQRKRRVLLIYPAVQLISCLSFGVQCRTENAKCILFKLCFVFSVSSLLCVVWQMVRSGLLCKVKSCEKSCVKWSVVCGTHCVQIIVSFVTVQQRENCVLKCVS